jgi:P-type E1-E2 ATPase
LGVQGEIGHQQIRVGKATFVSEQPIEVASNQTTIYISQAGEFIGYITFIDQVRPEASQTIDELRRQGIKHIMMLTGDHEGIANAVASEVSIQSISANCLPEDKTKIIAGIAKKQRPVIMVGDGVNDSPALAAADVGIAMGAHGATAASESADAVILKDDLSKISTLITNSKDTLRIAKQSVMIGIVICIVLMVIASTGVIPALLGAVLQEVIDTVCILSSLRARKKDVVNSYSEFKNR